MKLSFLDFFSLTYLIIETIHGCSVPLYPHVQCLNTTPHYASYKGGREKGKINWLLGYFSTDAKKSPKKTPRKIIILESFHPIPIDMPV